MNTEKRIKITINGFSATGKTIIGLIIKQALNRFGVDVNYGVDQHEMKEQSIQNYYFNAKEIFDSLKEKGLTVDIIEEQRIYNVKVVIDEKKLKRIGKYMSFLLRHDPKKENLEMDSRGYVEAFDLGLKLNITKGELEWIVDNNNKKRFEFSDDGKYIRATQGHSFDVDLGLQPAVPPRRLHHGTTKKNMMSIRSGGLKKMNRSYVHLSSDIEIAENVGLRHSKTMDNLWLIVVDAERMYHDGYKFFVTSNGVWLTDHVPSKYLIIH